MEAAEEEAVAEGAVGSEEAAAVSEEAEVVEAAVASEEEVAVSEEEAASTRDHLKQSKSLASILTHVRTSWSARPPSKKCHSSTLPFILRTNNKLEK